MPLPFSFQIHLFKELDSTNSYAKTMAEKDAAEGQVYVADFQTGGRGQFDRQWISPSGENLLFSILIRPKISPAQAPILTQITCRSVSQVLEEKYQIKTTIKKPNDVLADGKKICGILTESSSSSPKNIENVIIGIGLNVNAAPEGVIPESVCMKDLLGRNLDCQEILQYLLAQIGKDLESLYAPSV